MFLISLFPQVPEYHLIADGNLISYDWGDYIAYGYGNSELRGKSVQNAFPHALFPVFNTAERV